MRLTFSKFFADSFKIIFKKINLTLYQIKLPSNFRVTIETAEEAPSGPPVDIRVAAVDQHTLRVSWKPPLTEHWNGDILGYYVGYKKTIHGDDKPYLFETVEFIKEKGHEHQLQISNLEVFTEYAVVVQAFNKIGQGPMSDEVLGMISH